MKNGESLCEPTLSFILHGFWVGVADMSKKLLKSTAVVGSMTFLSRILGLVREIVFATTFGATAYMDAFLVAFKIPNFMRRLFAEGAFSQAFVPVLSEVKTKEDHAAVKDLIAHVAGLLGLVVFVISLLGMVIAGLVVAIFAPGFWHDPAKFNLAESLLRVMFPYLFFIALTALSGGVLNTYSKFAVPAFTPVLLNVVLILMSLYAAPHFAQPETAIAIGVVIAGVVQLAFQLPFIYRLGLLAWPKIKLAHPGVKKILKLMVPALFGASVVQIGLLVDTIFASFLQTGSVSWLYYSDRLMQFPLGVFGVALATVVLPHLSKQHALQDTEGYSKALDWAVRLVILMAVPAAVGLCVLAKPIIATIYQYGHFDLYDAQKARWSLMAFSSGLLFFIWVKVMVSAFYARQDMKTPVKIACVALACNVAFNFILVWPLAYVGIALSTAIAALVNTTALFVILHKRGIYKAHCNWWHVLFSVLVSSGVMGVILWWFARGDWAAMHMLTRVWHLALLLVVGVVSYVVLLALTGMRKKHFVL